MLSSLAKGFAVIFGSWVVVILAWWMLELIPGPIGSFMSSRASGALGILALLIFPIVAVACLKEWIRPER